MMDRASIMAWAEQAPWTDPAMVEQDLIICRALVDIFNKRYMEFSVGKPPSYKQFMQNMELKMQNPEFLNDTELLLRPEADKFDPERAFKMVREAFIERLPGRR